MDTKFPSTLSSADVTEPSSVTFSHPDPAMGSFRLLLQRELVRRCERNRSYSIRSFARNLEINHTSLIRLLNGERPLTKKMILRLGLRLGMKPRQLEGFGPEGPKSRATGVAKSAQMDFQQMTQDTFEVIADWYHHAILELTHVKDAQFDARWVARALGINIAEVKDAVDRLVRLGMLEVTSDGRWINRSGNNSSLGSDLRAAAFRRLQKQILELAAGALDHVPLEKRSQTSMTMAISTERLAQAEEKITQFRRELCAFLEAAPDRDAVYQLSISLFPLTQENQK
jgi:hypothetical protein